MQPSRKVQRRGWIAATPAWDRQDDGPANNDLLAPIGSDAHDELHRLAGGEELQLRRRSLPRSALPLRDGVTQSLQLVLQKQLLALQLGELQIVDARMLPRLGDLVFQCLILAFDLVEMG